MQRIQQLLKTRYADEAATLLAAVEHQMGGIPNILATMAHSPAALGAYLGFSGALARGRLPSALREQIALAVAGANRCDYCASVHTALGTRIRIPADELARNLRGDSADTKTRAALRFSSRIIEDRGDVPDEELAAVRRAGYSEEEIVEIVANTALNIFTNYFNHIAGTEIDFPVVSTADMATA